METQIHTVWAERVCGFAFRFLQKSEILGILDLETGNIFRPFPAPALLLFQGVPLGIYISPWKATINC